MGDPPPKPPLEYDRTVTTVTVRGFRTLLLLLVINTLMLGVFVAGPGASRFVQSQWRQWQARRDQRRAEQAMVAVQQKCLTHAFPTDLVVYEERPDAAARLLASGGPYRAIESDTTDSIERPIRREAAVAHWSTFANQLSHNTTGLVFLHERVTLTGMRRLVSAQWVASIAFRGNGAHEVRRQLHIHTFRPAGAGETAATAMSRAIPLTLKGGQPLSRHGRREAGPAMTLLAGQPDAGDLSHFTIPYLIDGRAAVIDCWIRDDSIDVKPRMSRPAFVGGEAGWELDAPAANSATAPTTAP